MKFWARLIYKVRYISPIHDELIYEHHMQVMNYLDNAETSQLLQGVKVMVRGQAELLNQTMSELKSGLLITIIVILLMLAVYFQSFKLSFTILSIIPTVVAGSVLLLLIKGKTLNIQSYMSTIVA